MNTSWSSELQDIDWAELQDLYQQALPGDKSIEHLQTVFANSRFKFFARIEGKLVAAGRALADGADCSYLCDIAVLPQFQGLGLGKEVISRLLHASQGHRKIMLYALPGKQGFYQRCGFLRMRTAMAIFKNQAAAIQSGLLEQV